MELYFPEVAMRHILLATVLSATAAQAAASEPVHAVSEYLSLGQGGLKNLVLSPETRHLFVSHRDEPDLLYQWHIDARKLVKAYRFDKGLEVQRVFPSPDGQLVLASCWSHDACRGGLVAIDPRKQEVIAQRNFQRCVWNIRFGDDGSRFCMPVYKQDPVWFDSLTLKPADPIEQAPKVDEAQAPRVWRIESYKSTIKTHGLYCRDLAGREHRLSTDVWQDNFLTSKDARYLAATTWHGELLIWRLEDGTLLAREKLAHQYGHLQYDSKQNLFLWGDCTDHNGKILSVRIREPRSGARRPNADGR